MLKLKRGGIILFGSMLLVDFYLISIPFFSVFLNKLIINYPIIQSRKTLEEFIEKEKGIKSCGKSIELIINSDTKTGEAKKINGKYFIYLNPEYTKKYTIVHEVYHICDGHTENFNPSRFIWFHEPKTSIYTAIRIFKDSKYASAPFYYFPIPPMPMITKKGKFKYNF